MTSLASESFEHGDRIPDRHALESGNLSPHLRWSGLPEETRSIAVICEDPDSPSGTFVHWLAWGIDPEAGELGEGEPAPREGSNGFGHSGYAGPRPPEGHGPHRYFFRVYALDAEPELGHGASREELGAALEGHVLAVGELMGTFER
ncbi:MAG TPA: YbhB/YbcL family Raf kinase inhibitor-like protein [Solirubrobacterales bacterium]